MQQLVVDLTGQPFPAAMKALVLTPLGLVHSTFEAPLPPAQRALAAAEYDVDETPLPLIVNPESAAAGLWSTPTNLARFLAEIQLGLEGQSSLVSRKVALRMTTPVVPIGVPDVFTGMGTFVEHHGATTYFGHDGRNDGFLAISRASATGGEGAVVMTNGAGGAPLLLETLRSIAVEYAWDGWLPPPIKPVHLAPAELRALAGRYGAGPDQSLTVVVEGGRLEAREPFRKPCNLVPIAADTFVGRLDAARFAFHHRASGIDELAKTPSEGETSLLTRIPEDTIEPLRLLEEGRSDEALSLYRALLASHPAEPAIAESRFDDIASDLLDRRLEFDRAIRVFRVEVALYPASANANAGLALAYLRADRRGEAAPFQAKALELFARETKRTEMERLLLGMRIARVKNLAALSMLADGGSSR